MHFACDCVQESKFESFHRNIPTILKLFFNFLTPKLSYKFQFYLCKMVGGTREDQRTLANPSTQYLCILHLNYDNREFAT